MSDFSYLKHEILEWATSNVAMKEFTTHDVYNQVHSALSSEQTSDALRRLYKEGKLNRKEFMDGNRKKFIYSLANVNVDNKVNVKLFSDRAEEEKPKEDLCGVNYLTIPNNFTIELKTPSGFVITIKSSDLNDQK